MGAESISNRQLATRSVGARPGRPQLQMLSRTCRGGSRRNTWFFRARQRRQSRAVRDHRGDTVFSAARQWRAIARQLGAARDNRKRHPVPRNNEHLAPSARWHRGCSRVCIAWPPSEGIYVLPGAIHDRRKRAASPLGGGAQQQEDRARDGNRPRHRDALHRRGRASGVAARSRAERRGDPRGRAARTVATAAGRERGVEGGRRAQAVHPRLAGQEATAAAAQDPHAARARSRAPRELRHASPLCDGGARLAEEGADDSPRGSARRSGGAGRLRQDGDDDRCGDGTHARALGAHRHPLVQSVSVRVADVRADDRGGVQRARPRVVVLRRDGGTTACA